MDNEFLDIFTHKLVADIPLMQGQLSTLLSDKAHSIPILFRAFHNYKASSSYLGLQEIYLLVTQGENVLNALRLEEKEAREHDLKWLNACISQLQLWCDQLLTGMPLSSVNPALFPTIAILDDSEKTAEIMQGLTLLYADTNSTRAKKMKAPLEHVFTTVSTVDNIEEIKAAIKNESCDIVILNMLEESISIAEELITLKPDLALITAIPELRAHQKSRLLLKGVTHPIISPIQANELKRQLHNIVTSHFSKVHTIISHQKIYNFIQGIDPLSSSVKEISRLCDDPESSIKDLIHIIESDSITTANILHAANMPIYAVKSTSSIEQAVVSFGKRLIKALTLSDLAYTLGSLKLTAYGISEEEFKQASRVRLALMNSWYAQVNVQDLNILCSSSILGNLGQILINQELIAQGLDDEFRRLKPTELSRAEVKLLKTSSAFVTADILEFWGLESELVDSIRYSDSPFNASSTRNKQLACANAVVYKMVSPYGKLEETIPQCVKTLMSKAGLKLDVLEEAIASIR